MARTTLLALLIAVNLSQAWLLGRMAGGAGPPSPTVVIVWAPQPDLPAALEAAARRVGPPAGAEWHNASRLLCHVLERYGLIPASGSVDDLALRFLAGPVLPDPDLVRRARATRDQVRRSQQEAGALEREIGVLTERVALRCPGADREPGTAGDTTWTRLQERLEAPP